MVLAIDAVVVLLFGAAEPHASATAAVLGTSVVVLAIICGASLFETLSLRAGGAAVARRSAARIERGFRPPSSDCTTSSRRWRSRLASPCPRCTCSKTRMASTRSPRAIRGRCRHCRDAWCSHAAQARGIAGRGRRTNSATSSMATCASIFACSGWTFGAGCRHRCAHRAGQLAGREPGSRKDGAGALMLAALAVMLLGYIGVFFGRLLQAAVSRHRERLADASSVQFTRNPTGLTGALLKIAGTHSGSRLVTPEAEEVAHMLFAAGLPRLFATHPPIEERLKALDLRQEGNLPALPPRPRATRSGSVPRTHRATPRPADEAGATHSRRHRIAVFVAPRPMASPRWPAPWRTKTCVMRESARDAVPEGLRDFVQSADHAVRLVLVVLASKVPEVLTQQRRILESAYGAEFTNACSACRRSPTPCRPHFACPPSSSCFQRCAGCHSASASSCATWSLRSPMPMTASTCSSAASPCCWPRPAR